MMWIPQAR